MSNLVDKSDTSSNENEIKEYYLLIDESSFSNWFRIPSHEFEDMFELLENSKYENTYQFNSKTRDIYRSRPYVSLDNYICGCEINHIRSDWRVGNDSSSFIVKGVYYWHNNVYG